MSKNYKTKINLIYKKFPILSLVFFLLFILVFQFAEADDFTSTNFISRDPIVNDFGGDSTSTNFDMTNSGGQTVTGESTSTDFILQSGFLYFDSFAPKSQNWRWYDDETNETPTTALASENVAPSDIEDLNLLKLRISVKETNDIGLQNLKFKLQYSTVSNFSSDVHDLVETGSCNGSSVWCYADGAGADNGVITTKVLSDADSCTSSTGDGCGTHNESGVSTATFIHKKSATTEYEFVVKRSGGVANTTYFFRAYNNLGVVPVPLNSGESYPSLSTAGATLTFSINGLSSGTSTGGVTTDITTTTTSVPFGTLSINTQIEAAHRLGVTTNASAGYQIFTLQTQGLLGFGGAAEISPVDAVNASPAAWAIPSLALGAYGYHTTDSTLASGSTRFSADNTYAKFETDPKEIAYSSAPVSNETTDVVYKTQVTDQQNAGLYDSKVIYIVVPVF